MYHDLLVIQDYNNLFRFVLTCKKIINKNKTQNITLDC